MKNGLGLKLGLGLYTLRNIKVGHRKELTVPYNFYSFLWYKLQMVEPQVAQSTAHEAKGYIQAYSFWKRVDIDVIQFVKHSKSCIRVCIYVLERRVVAQGESAVR